jgi:hypothetical protein
MSLAPTHKAEREWQLCEIAALCADTDIAMLAAEELMFDRAADGFGIRIADGRDMYGADISRNRDATNPTGWGPIHLDVWSNGWPYQRPIAGNA